MKRIAIILSILFSLNIYSQKTDKDLGSWYTYAGSHKINDKFSLKSVAWFQFKDVGNHLQNTLFRLGGNYKINKHFNTTLGYSYVGKSSGGEHRIYEDFNYSHKIESLKLSHRLRVEHRFPKHKDAINRLRYRILVPYHLYKNISAYAYDEVAIEFKEGNKFTFNRITIGISYKATDNIKLKVGYINELKPKKDKNVIELGLVISH